MDENINEKIKIYCEKLNMKMDNFHIMPIKEGYLAKDDYTSVMFDKEGKVLSLPMHNVYGNGTTQVIGKIYAIGIYGVLALIILIIIYNSIFV